MRKNFGTIAPLALIILIDALGIVIAYPLFASIFSAHSTLEIVANYSIETRNFLYGITSAAYPLCMFIAAPLMGDLSDSIGRKKAMFICLLGTLLGFVLSAIAIEINSLGLLIFSRMLDGFTASSQPIAQAAIVDMSKNQNKSANMAMIVLAVNIGMICGPLISGFFGDPVFHHMFNLATPFWIAAGLALFNIIWLIITFKETHEITRKKLHLWKGFNLLLMAFSNRSLRGLMLIFLCSQLSWMLYAQAMPLLLSQDYHYSVFYIGLFSAILNFASCMALLFILRWLLRYFDNKNIILLMLCILFISIFSAAWCIYHHGYQWLFGIFISTSNAIYTATVFVLFSEATDITSQGFIMGMTGSISAISFASSGLLAGPLLYLHTNLPLYISSIFIIVAILRKITLR